MRIEHWGVAALWKIKGTCINILGRMAMVQVVEKLGETIDRRTAAWAGVVLLIIG